MNSKTGHTAILFFSRTAKEEAFSKRIHIPSEKLWNYELYRKMISHTLSVAKESKMEVFFFDEKRQQGDHFGARLAHAFSDLFSKGYTSVISIGNDCPMLCCGDLTRTESLLKQGKNVVGPTQKGGTYLIGMRADTFDQEAFSKLDWSTNRLCEQLKNQLGDVVLLFQKNDINNRQDLKGFIESASHYLAWEFKKLLFGNHRRKSFDNCIGFSKSYYYNKPLRAPPVGC